MAEIFSRADAYLDIQQLESCFPGDIVDIIECLKKEQGLTLTETKGGFAVYGSIDCLHNLKMSLTALEDEGPPHTSDIYIVSNEQVPPNIEQFFSDKTFCFGDIYGTILSKSTIAFHPGHFAYMLINATERVLELLKNNNSQLRLNELLTSEIRVDVEKGKECNIEEELQQLYNTTASDKEVFTETLSTTFPDRLLAELEHEIHPQLILLLKENGTCLAENEIPNLWHLTVLTIDSKKEDVERCLTAKINRFSSDLRTSLAQLCDDIPLAPQAKNRVDETPLVSMNRETNTPNEGISQVAGKEIAEKSCEKELNIGNVSVLEYMLKFHKYDLHKIEKECSVDINRTTDVHLAVIDKTSDTQKAKRRISQLAINISKLRPTTTVDLSSVTEEEYEKKFSEVKTQVESRGYLVRNKGQVWSMLGPHEMYGECILIIEKGFNIKASQMSNALSNKLKENRENLPEKRLSSPTIDVPTKHLHTSVKSSSLDVDKAVNIPTPDNNEKVQKCVNTEQTEMISDKSVICTFNKERAIIQSSCSEFKDTVLPSTNVALKDSTPPENDALIASANGPQPEEAMPQDSGDVLKPAINNTVPAEGSSPDNSNPRSSSSGIHMESNVAVVNSHAVASVSKDAECLGTIPPDRQEAIPLPSSAASAATSENFTVRENNDQGPTAANNEQLDTPKDSDTMSPFANDQTPKERGAAENSDKLISDTDDTPTVQDTNELLSAFANDAMCEDHILAENSYSSLTKDHTLEHSASRNSRTNVKASDGTASKQSTPTPENSEESSSSLSYVTYDSYMSVNNTEASADTETVSDKSVVPETRCAVSASGSTGVLKEHSSGANSSLLPSPGDDTISSQHASRTYCDAELSVINDPIHSEAIPNSNVLSPNTDSAAHEEHALIETKVKPTVGPIPDECSVSENSDRMPSFANDAIPDRLIATQSRNTESSPVNGSAKCIWSPANDPAQEKPHGSENSDAMSSPTTTEFKEYMYVHSKSSSAVVSASTNEKGYECMSEGSGKVSSDAEESSSVHDNDSLLDNDGMFKPSMAAEDREIVSLHADTPMELSATLETRDNNTNVRSGNEFIYKESAPTEGSDVVTSSPNGVTPEEDMVCKSSTAMPPVAGEVYDGTLQTLDGSEAPATSKRSSNSSSKKPIPPEHNEAVSSVRNEDMLDVLDSTEINTASKARAKNPVDKDHKFTDNNEAVSSSINTAENVFTTEPEDDFSALVDGAIPKAYLAGNGLWVYTWEADITKLHVDVVVNAANERLEHNGGVAYAIARAAGPEIVEQSKILVQNYGLVRVSGMHITTAGNMPAKKVYHTVGPQWRNYTDTSKCAADLTRAFYNCLHTAHINNYTSIAFPALSSGIFGVPITVVAESAIKAIDDFVHKFPATKLGHVHLVDIRYDTTMAYQIELQKHKHTFQAKPYHEYHTWLQGHSLATRDTHGRKASVENEVKTSTKSKDEKPHFDSKNQTPYRLSASEARDGREETYSDNHISRDDSLFGSTVSSGTGSTFTSTDSDIAARKVAEMSTVYCRGSSRDCTAEEHHMTAGASAKETITTEEEDKCSICLENPSDPVALSKCKHVFCKICINTCFNKMQPKCPNCGEVYGDIRGDQPEGFMTVDEESYSLPGHQDCGTLVIYYQIPSGIQTEEHPCPGRPFSGTTRKAYLPANAEGRKVLELLRRAFDSRMIFTVGRSATSGKDNTVIWNGIHHKTNTCGGPQLYGYPDPTYLTRVQQELATQGFK